MTLTDSTLTIHKGDEISFYEFGSMAINANDSKFFTGAQYISGKVIGSDIDNDLIVETQFAHYTIQTRYIHSVNNLCVAMNNLINNLRVRVAV